MKLVDIYTPRIRLRNGKVIFAKSYGLVAFHFRVTREQHERYMARRNKSK